MNYHWFSPSFLCWLNSDESEWRESWCIVDLINRRINRHSRMCVCMCVCAVKVFVLLFSPDIHPIFASLLLPFCCWMRLHAPPPYPAVRMCTSVWCTPTFPSIKQDEHNRVMSSPTVSDGWSFADQWPRAACSRSELYIYSCISCK